MAWIIGAVVIVGFIWLMVANERFRRVGFGLIALIVIGIVVLWLGERKNHREFLEQIARENAAIPHSQVELRDLALGAGSYPTLTGTVVNHSSYPIRQVTLVVSLRDCPTTTSEAGCTIIGQDDVSAYVDVPSGQARAINTSVNLTSAAAPVGHWGWIYSLKTVSAKLD